MTPAARLRLMLALLPAFCSGTAGMANPSPSRTLVLLLSEHDETAAPLAVFASERLASDFWIVILSERLVPDETPVGGAVRLRQPNESRQREESAPKAVNPIREISGADVLLVSLGRRSVPAAQLAAMRRHVAAGKAVVGIRTTNRSFASAAERRSEDESHWPAWEPEVIGGIFQGDAGLDAMVTITSLEPRHPLTRPLELPWTSRRALFRYVLQPGAEPILMGTVPGERAAAVAWLYVRKDRGRTFHTSLGEASDFNDSGFRDFLRHGILWAANMAYWFRIDVPIEITVPLAPQVPSTPRRD